MKEQHTRMGTLNGPFSVTTQVSRDQKDKTNLNVTEQIVSGSGISWAICKSAPRSRQITTPAAPHHSVFLQAGCPSCRPINSVKKLKATKKERKKGKKWKKSKVESKGEKKEEETERTK